VCAQLDVSLFSASAHDALSGVELCQHGLPTATLSKGDGRRRGRGGWMNGGDGGGGDGGGGDGGGGDGGGGDGGGGEGKGGYLLPCGGDGGGGEGKGGYFLPWWCRRPSRCECGRSETKNGEFGGSDGGSSGSEGGGPEAAHAVAAQIASITARNRPSSLSMSDTDTKRSRCEKQAV